MAPTPRTSALLAAAVTPLRVRGTGTLGREERAWSSELFEPHQQLESLYPRINALEFYPVKIHGIFLLLLVVVVKLLLCHSLDQMRLIMVYLSCIFIIFTHKVRIY